MLDDLNQLVNSVSALVVAVIGLLNVIGVFTSIIIAWRTRLDLQHNTKELQSTQENIQKIESATNSLMDKREAGAVAMALNQERENVAAQEAQAPADAGH
jgi:AmiR/NasT family two-component response regulator